MLNIQTPETTEIERFVVIREDECGEENWIMVADMVAGKENDRCWCQIEEAIKNRHYRICHFASKGEAEQAVADCITRWGFGFVKTQPTAVPIMQTVHHEFRTFDVMDLLGR
jgi:hypothetical protein